MLTHTFYDGDDGVGRVQMAWVLVLLNQLANPEAYEEALGCMGGGRIVVAVGGRDAPVLRQAPPKVLSPSSPLKKKK
jgi:hypothetical protein